MFLSLLVKFLIYILNHKGLNERQLLCVHIVLQSPFGELRDFRTFFLRYCRRIIILLHENESKREHIQLR